MRVMKKLKTQNRWEGKGNHWCESGSTCVSSILPCPCFCIYSNIWQARSFTKKKWKTKSQYGCMCRWQSPLTLEYKKKIVPRLNKCIDKGGDYVEKYLKLRVAWIFSLDFLNKYFNFFFICIFTFRMSYIHKLKHVDYRKAYCIVQKQII